MGKEKAKQTGKPFDPARKMTELAQSKQQSNVKPEVRTQATQREAQWKFRSTIGLQVAINASHKETQVKSIAAMLCLLKGHI